MDDRHKPVRNVDAPGYPTLEEFRIDRREFLKALGVTAAVVMTSSWSLLAEAGDPNMPLPGSTPAPDQFQIRLPREGNGTAYLRQQEYAVFTLTLATYERDFADYAETHAADLLSAATTVLSTQACVHLQVEKTRLDVEQTLLDAINAAYQRAVGEAPGTHALTFTLVSCEIEMPLAGDIAEPSYP